MFPSFETAANLPHIVIQLMISKKVTPDTMKDYPPIHEHGASQAGPGRPVSFKRDPLVGSMLDGRVGATASRQHLYREVAASGLGMGADVPCPNRKRPHGIQWFHIHESNSFPFDVLLSYKAEVPVVNQTEQVWEQNRQF